MLQHFLEMNIQHQAVMHFLAQSLQVATREHLSQRTSAPAAATPLPDPGREAQHLLLTQENDIEAYLEAFERITLHENWGSKECSRMSGPPLSGEACTSYYVLSPEEVADYRNMKWELLAQCGRTPQQAVGRLPPVDLPAQSQPTWTDGRPLTHHQGVPPARPKHSRRGFYGPIIRTLPPAERQVGGIQACNNH